MSTKIETENVTGNMPEKKFSTGGLTATVWENQGKNRAGIDVSYRTVSFQRRYTDKNGEWQSTSTLRVSDIFVSGSEWGKVKALINDKGENLIEATSSMPVEVLGFDANPFAGDDFIVLESESAARKIAEYRFNKKPFSSQLICYYIST